MNAVPILLIGIPAAVAKYAEYRWNRQKSEGPLPAVDREDCWAGFTEAKLNNPPLAEMEVR